MNLVIYHATGTIETRALTTEPTLAEYQAIVGGYIEGYQVEYNGNLRWLYCNEDGKRLNLPINLLASKFFPLKDMGRGTVVICDWEMKNEDDE